jgi:putative ABC transport system permease protein
LPLLPRLANFWRNLFHRTQREQELTEELDVYLEMLIENKLKEGLDPGEARRAALLDLGGKEQVKEQVRQSRPGHQLEIWWQDLRYALRMLQKNPGFAMAAVVTLALGIGANTAIFSVCNAVLLKPPPYYEPGRIVMLWEHRRGQTPQTVAPANFVDWREQTRSFSDVAAIRTSSMILIGQGEPARLKGAAVSANFLSLFGVQLTLGRNFLAEEDQPDRNHVVILSSEK